jgi:SAM-dependent methyltransferase
MSNAQGDNENPPSEAIEVPDSDTPIDDLIARLRERVNERRESGDYPEGLEEQLEEHFHRIVFHRMKSQVDQLQADVDAIDSHMDFSLSGVGHDSGMPGGEMLHKALNKAMVRYTDAMQNQLREYAEAIRRAIRTLAAAIQDPNTHTHGDLIGHLDAILERLNSYERAPGSGEEAVGDLRRRVEALERAEAARDFKPWFTNDAFEEHFRGSKESIYGAYEDLADELGGSGPVLDIGCGRGEFLELLVKRGIECEGIEIDPILAEEAAAAGLSVVAGDGLAYLASKDDGSLGGIVLIQVIEHLTIQQQLDLVALAYEKVRPNGRVIIETVNPQSLYVYAHAFYIDPTHTRPVHPAYLAFLFEQAGFKEVKWDWRNPPPEQDMLEKHSDDPNSAANRNVERLNTLLFDTSDYALIVMR